MTGARFGLRLSLGEYRTLERILDRWVAQADPENPTDVWQRLNWQSRIINGRFLLDGRTTK